MSFENRHIEQLQTEATRVKQHPLRVCHVLVGQPQMLQHQEIRQHQTVFSQNLVAETHHQVCAHQLPRLSAEAWGEDVQLLHLQHGDLLVLHG